MLNHKRNRIHNEYSKNSDSESEGDCEEVRKRIKALFKTFYGYTDDNNPFGDPELSKPFFWKKKIEALKTKGLEPKLDSQTIILKLKICKKEIERTRKRRLEREEVKESIEHDKNRAIREKEEQTFEEWRQKDEKFHLAQEKLRTEIRIKQGREKPVDFINKVALIWRGLYHIPNDFFEIPEYQQPYLLYELLDDDSLSELYAELKTQLAIDVERLANKKFVCFYIDIASNFKQFHDLKEEDLVAFINYWQSMIVIIESYIFPEKNIKNLAPELRDEIENILIAKTFEELDELEGEIQKNMDEQILSLDIQFWSNVLYNLRIHRCKMVLDNLYDLFKKENSDKLEVLKRSSEQNARTTLGKVGGQMKQQGAGVSIKYDEEEGCLSPVMYESDEELRKLSLCEHDYLIRISESRKLLLAEQMGKWQKSNFEADKKNKIVMLNEKLVKEQAQALLQIQNQNRAQITIVNESTDALNESDIHNPTNPNNNNKNSKKNSEALLLCNKNNIKDEDEIIEVIDTNDIIEQESVNNSEEEIEKFLAKPKKNSKDKNKLSNSSQNNYKNEMDLLLGTVCYPVNTLKASRFYLKDDVMYDFNLSHEMKEIESQELGEGESIFNDVVPLTNSNYMWASKYKPRKPRFFNRVRTGYEWNKYNQAHYDYDNPPPKVIQGYKFNIFFPDLIDKTKAPQYSLDRSDTTDTCILKFHAGPPYEDIAFKIVNREWDMTEKAGFKNVFDRGILYLYFNFKRYRYKR